eukprot:snap_masked-scaffold_7-processed-gene-19.60-mRNA-1 protein AED:0.09 eAED:0.09 QI:0/-1/0/1/-1/1/1/0/661
MKRKTKPQSELPEIFTKLHNYAENPPTLTTFSDLPISTITLKALTSSNFTKLTPIQSLSILPALLGHDLLCQAQTGSGKTLSFLIPLLEKLFLTQFTSTLGVGAIVLSPTRELAVQTYDVLRMVGKHHNLTAGVFVGSGQSKIKGTKRSKEADRLRATNIVVSTPGRLLEHLQKTDGVELSNCKLLVLDEADRLVDAGFKKQITDIIGYLPPSKRFSKEKKVDVYRRQTLLFSATLERSVKSLGHLSLRTPKFVSVIEDNKLSLLPKQLNQVYSIVEAQDKLNLLWSFIRTHLHSKVIVFLSVCKQVQFVHALFSRLQPGVKLTAIHGKMKQMQRLKVYYDFIEETQGVVLFATDVVSRGLDFPNVDWVVQVDVGEISSYVHRAGRTARFTNKGKSWLLLSAREAKGYLPQLKEEGVCILEKEVNPRKIVGMERKFGAILASDKRIKILAEKAFRGYLRSVFLMGDDSVWEWRSMSMKRLSESYGLVKVPRVKMSGEGGEIGRQELRKLKNRSGGINGEVTVESDSEEEEGDLFVEVKKKRELPQVPVREGGLKREKRLKIDEGGVKKGVRGKKILFGEDSVEVVENLSWREKGKERLEESRELDENKEKERVREKRAKEKNRRRKRLEEEECSEEEERNEVEGEEESDLEQKALRAIGFQ